MIDLLAKLNGKTLDGAGLDVGRVDLFFTDGTMATVEVEVEEVEGDPLRGRTPTGDLSVTFGTYEREGGPGGPQVLLQSAKSAVEQLALILETGGLLQQDFVIEGLRTVARRIDEETS